MKKSDKKLISWIMIIAGLALFGYVSVSIFFQYLWQIIIAAVLTVGGFVLRENL